MSCSSVRAACRPAIGGLLKQVQYAIIIHYAGAAEPKISNLIQPLCLQHSGFKGFFSTSLMPHDFLL